MESSDIAPPKKRARTLGAMLAERNRDILSEIRKSDKLVKKAEEAKLNAEAIANETSEARADRLAVSKQRRISRQAEAIANEIPEARADRFAEAKQKRISRISSETPEARADRLTERNPGHTCPICCKRLCS